MSIVWWKNSEMRVEWGGKKSKGLTFVQNSPSGLRQSVIQNWVHSVQSDNFLIPCRRDLIFLIFSHQKWRNKPGMGVKNRGHSKISLILFSFNNFIVIRSIVNVSFHSHSVSRMIMEWVRQLTPPNPLCRGSWGESIVALILISSE